jgi:deoxyribonuclease II
MLSALNESGKPVDWWFMYKVSSHSESATAQKATGGEYVYFDADGAKKNAKLALSPDRVDKNQGALFNTLNVLYGPAAKANKQLGFFFYNDENPVTGAVVDDRGHTKGVLAFDLGSNSGFWLVQSTPKFPIPDKYSFPKTGMEMAQTFLCVTLKEAGDAQKITHEMYACQQPNVYYASAIPAGLQKNDTRVLLMKDQAASGNTPMTCCLPLYSRGGQKFLAIAKNKWWGLDFYNDLVGPRLHDNLEVETWEHDPTPGDLDDDKIHKVMPMKSVNLKPIGAPFSWSEDDDHAKLAISEQTEKVHWVCVGDINFTKAQEKRGGGTLAFICEPLWKSLIEILSVKPEAPAKR